MLLDEVEDKYLRIVGRASFGTMLVAICSFIYADVLETVQAQRRRKPLRCNELALLTIMRELDRDQP
jgi:hypothetical protein